MTPRALLALLFLVPAPSLGTLAAMRYLRGPIGQGIYGLSKVWILALPVLWTLYIDQGTLSWSPPTKGGLATGAALGLIIGVVILIAFSLIGKRWIDVAHVRKMAQQNGIASPIIYLGFAVYLTLINSLLEEYVWRWFVFEQCAVLLSRWAAVLAAALLFTIHHIIALKLQFGWRITLLGSLGVFTGGALWSGLYQHYHSIWPGYVSHVFIDIAILIIGWRLIQSAPDQPAPMEAD